MTNSETITQRGRRYRYHAGPFSDASAAFDYLAAMVELGELVEQQRQDAIVEGAAVYLLIED